MDALDRREPPIESIDEALDERGSREPLGPPITTALTAAITHTATRAREACCVRNVATGISTEVVDAYVAAASRDDRSHESVLHVSVFEAVEDDPTLRDRLRAMLGADRIAVLRYDGEEPLVMLTICDDVVMCGRSNPNAPPEGLETIDAHVRAWAEVYYETSRADATPVAPDAFTM